MEFVSRFPIGGISNVNFSVNLGVEMDEYGVWQYLFIWTIAGLSILTQSSCHQLFEHRYVCDYNIEKNAGFPQVLRTK